MRFKSVLTAVSIGVLIAATPVFAVDLLTPGEPIELSGTHGKFDFIKVDETKRRLLASHTGNGSLDVIDVDASKLIKSVATGAAQGVAIDEKNGLYYVSVSNPPSIVIVDSAKLEVVGQVSLPSAADLVAYHPATNRVFVCNDEKPEMWVIDPVAKTIATTLTFPGGGMEDLAFDDQGNYLFQNLKATSELAKVDPKEAKILDKWSTMPADKPHGLAMVPGANAVLIVGGTGKLVLLGLDSGKVLASTDVAPKVDEIAYDSGLKRTYCASGTGTISVVSVDQGKLATLGTVPSAPGAHSIAVDPKTNTVWIVFAKDSKAYAQAYTAK
jgi:DNA-binding beta-propeller fold protein YncE